MKDKVDDENLVDKEKSHIEDEDFAGKKNDDWWRLEKSQIGGENFLRYGS